ncbi:uncharacterized protein JCM15063_002810 [Sporobolomyces koalae]|uniref:uncharacterized protein n=1 Tax=Sporobolomyces koalae TaxID=500713 RepID=UPI00316D9A65
MWPFSSCSTKDRSVGEPSASRRSESSDEMRAVAVEEERRVVRKIDWLLMPLLTISFGLQYYDKAVLGSASIFGIIKDLGLSTKSIDPVTGKTVVSTLRYSTANSAFYWGYIVAVLPFALLLQRLPLAKTLSACIFFWGVTVILTVVVQSYQGLVVQRVFLGVLESSVSPGFVMITTQWYRKSEQASRIGIWYSATGIFSAFSGVVNYGLGKAGGSLHPWKYMYLFAGAWTILWAGVILVLVPDSPRTSHRWFNDHERTILMRRARENKSGRIELSTFDWAQAKEAVCDFKVWIFMVMGAAIYICNGGVTAFGARIVSSFGYSPLTTIAILIPGGAFTCASIYLFTWIASRWKNSLTWLIPISCIPVIVGSAIIWGSSWHHRGVPLFGYYLLPTFGAPYVLLLSLASSNIAGSTKKSLTTGAIFVGYNVGNIVAPYTVFTDEKPIRYRSTWIAIMVSMVVTMLLSIVLRIMLSRENDRRDQQSQQQPQLQVERGQDEKERDGLEAILDDELESVEKLDLTDWKNPNFRYSL